MAIDWAITAAAERLTLDERNRGEITFTVTNPGPAPDRVVLEAVPGDNAAQSWFTITEPQRSVPPGGSVAYLMSTAVPPGTPAGTYSVQARAYSADTAPEETSRLSTRVAFEVKPAVPAKKRRWWPFAVAAGLVVVVLAVVGWLVFRPNGVTVPDVTNRPLADAEKTLTDTGFALGKISKVPDAARENGIVTAQDPPRGHEPRKDRTVDLTVVANPTPEFPLTVAVTGSGVVSGSGIACPGGCTALIASGTQVTLAALANPQHVFEGWGGSCAGTTGMTCRFTMPGGSASVSARFAPVPVTSPSTDPNPPVPDVVGLPAAAARDLITRQGFTVQQASAVDNLCEHIGRVMRQTPSAGTRLPRGSSVRITIGTPPTPPRQCP
jgi:hypothetical protein